MAHQPEDVGLEPSFDTLSENTNILYKKVIPTSTNGNDKVDAIVEGDANEGENGDNGDDLLPSYNEDDDGDLPQCKIKRNYSCNLCPFFSQNPRSFLYHSRDVHFDRIKIFECSQCLYASKHSQKLQRHINMIHVAGKSKTKKSSKSVKTDRKKEIKSSKPQLSDHFEEEFVSQTDTESENSLIVQERQKAGEEPLDFNSEKEKTADGEFKYSICSFTNKTPKLIRRHEKIVHLKKRFLRCNRCSYVTHVKARYTKHVKYHSMPMIKCDLCDFRTPYKWNLDRHYKNHCGTGNFQCSKCNFRADIKQSLTVHEMNHHVPPVGQGAVMARKRNKVGASEVAVSIREPHNEDSALFEAEREHTDLGSNDQNDGKQEEMTVEPDLQNIRNVKIPYTNRRESANNNHLQTDFIHPDDIVPRYGQIYVKNLKCKFCSYKAVFSHEIWRHEKRIHGYIRPEHKKENVPKRPPPKLIPIHNKNLSNGSNPSPILKVPAIKNNAIVSSVESSSCDKSVNENEFNEMCKNSCLTSSLKDFVSLIGDEEGLKTIPDSSREDLEASCSGWISESAESTDIKMCDLNKQKQTELLKKKNASFFDKLKEKLLTGGSEEQSLFCEICGHESKCLSEAATHLKRHSDSNFKSNGHLDSDIVLSGAELSSTRCQHCRHRCKTSTDLINHLKSCKAFGAAHDTQVTDHLEFTDNDVKLEDLSNEDDDHVEEQRNSLENKVFVWNDLRQRSEEEEEEGEGMDIEILSNEDCFSEAVAQMYGTVTSKGSDNTESGTLVMEIDPRLNLTVKKVFKCPHCSFWASTASRFHVHIVGHLNKKPFECSLCLYRSNWRWDITKHIRLKSARDPSHLEAQVNMTDETGRRNYSKYNKYLTMMKVQEPTAESSGTGRRSKPADATQGNVTERDIIPLPAPPRLTRAPPPGTSHQMPQGIPLRPPPPLKAAHQSVQAQSSSVEPLKEATKKTLWKCKKCNFRHSVKNNVLAHVKEHYGKKEGNLGILSDSGLEASDTNETSSAVSPKPVIISPSTVSSKPVTRTPSYKCGHCQQASNWKHVIQRHCRLKHNGNALIQVGWKETPKVQAETAIENSENLENSIELISCDICPFTTDTEGDLTAHKLNHVDRPGSIFKCSYCPFYVPSKIAVLEHMEIHGVNDGCDLAALKVDNFDPSECNEDFSSRHNGKMRYSSKRYKCRQCPYLSNSRTQFLYHKQFHRPRDAPFKCMYCSYNVSRRHLLHQHLRVHHKQQEEAVSPEETCETSDMSLISYHDVNTTDMPEIPLVWVLKLGNFHKMFKCRWCPHVNSRKINIQEHEKMHKSNDEDLENIQSGLKLRCPDCNYTCNNAGVLASHVKVHQGFYGEIRCLVDPTKSDAEQITELQKSLIVVEPEVVIKEELDTVSEESEKRTGEAVTSQPENSYSHSFNPSSITEGLEEPQKVLSFCNKCPARFFFKKELRIHSKFHTIHLPFRCSFCTYTARQRPHLLAHYKIHSEEYQHQTNNLINLYSISSDFPKPNVVLKSNDPDSTKKSAWIVNCPEDPVEQEKSYYRSKLEAKYVCNRCPAKFFKSVALQYHLTLHGSSYAHKCKYCDYSVKNYGNLIKHLLVHGERATKNKNGKHLKFAYEFPISGTDLIENQNAEKAASLAEESEAEFSRMKTDPQFGNLMHGSPEFIYPTILKNGKIKQKRYKCHKCPSAFEKRDQYRIHLSLHGSKQKYRCEKCDYSVKYYANYVQHMRKHQNHDEALKRRKSDNGFNTQIEQKIINKDNASFFLSSIERQSLILEGKKKKMFDASQKKDHYDCLYCPYVSDGREKLDSHSKRHYRVSKIKWESECIHCDYSVPQKNLLKEHIKIHFSMNSKYKAEAYLKCSKMELWCSEELKEAGESGNDVLVFQDRGEDVDDRFFPQLQNGMLEDNSSCKIFIKLDTWEPFGENTEDSPLISENNDFFDKESISQRKVRDSSATILTEDNRNRNLIEITEDESEKFAVENVKPKVKRWRGKNWRCKKCPHAFGKKDQFERHIALHGSNQRHNCDICDYSVKFYTNYVQHMRMHQMHEPDKVILVKKNSQNIEESDGKPFSFKNRTTCINKSSGCIDSSSLENKEKEANAKNSGGLQGQLSN